LIPPEVRTYIANPNAAYCTGDQGFIENSLQRIPQVLFYDYGQNFEGESQFHKKYEVAVKLKLKGGKHHEEKSY
jgi:hypothetical protein